MTNPVTANFGIAKPNPANDISLDVGKLAEAFDTIDAVMKLISDAVDTRAPVSHPHTMAQIEGLLSALAGKMNANQAFSLDSLSDVNGAGLAAIGYVLVKAANGQWLPSSPLAALGNHEHSIAQIVGLLQALAAKADASAVYTRSEVDALISAGGIKIGQTIEWNSLTLPTGFLKENGAAISRSTYNTLFQTIGTTFGAGDGSTTFNVPDSRGVVARGLDDGRGLDAGRTLGSYQADANAPHTHGVNDPGHAHPHTGFGGSSLIIATGPGLYYGASLTSAATTGISIQSSGGPEARMKNIAKLKIIRAF
ncbi:hypothetical protein D4A92_19680 [Rhizobium rosettiformans]|uniref:Phage tail collar domain-containing protein n=1 Tax=Rhizobium rosettiformans TaxID=1368430 RepID=A0ABX7F1D0_9HYPH|nr:tail fiber protein [Rhizobium rosettiformans]QRF53507.1 hypothetical protein D4A92_19680 [Rhizobium rosettiformans]